MVPFMKYLMSKNSLVAHLLTIEQLVHGAQVQMPPAHGRFNQPQKVKKDEGVQPELGRSSTSVARNMALRTLYVTFVA